MSENMSSLAYGDSRNITCLYMKNLAGRYDYVSINLEEDLEKRSGGQKVFQTARAWDNTMSHEVFQKRLPRDDVGRGRESVFLSTATAGCDVLEVRTSYLLQPVPAPQVLSREADQSSASRAEEEPPAENFGAGIFGRGAGDIGQTPVESFGPPPSPPAFFVVAKHMSTVGA